MLKNLFEIAKILFSILMDQVLFGLIFTATKLADRLGYTEFAIGLNLIAGFFGEEKHLKKINDLVHDYARRNDHKFLMQEMKLRSKVSGIPESEFMEMEFESYLKFGSISSAMCQHCKEYHAVDYFGKCMKCGSEYTISKHFNVTESAVNKWFKNAEEKLRNGKKG